MVLSCYFGALTLLLASVEGFRIPKKRGAATANATLGARVTRSIEIDSATREYAYFVPAQCSNRQCPMLLLFHGQSGSIPRGEGYDGNAESSGFVTVYLQGMADGGCGTGWNTIAPGQDISGTCTSPNMSGTCCYDSCRASSSCSNSNTGCRWATCNDDVAFTAAVLDEMRSAVTVGDIYLQGESNGGMFSHTLMTTMPGTFKGVVSVCGLPLAGQWEPGQYGVPPALSSTSVLYMHGRSDRVIPQDGGWAGGWNYVSGAVAMRELASNAGCSSSTSAWPTPYDGGRRDVACVRHDNCPNGVTIAQCLYNGGHSAWPPNGNDLLFWFLAENTA